MTTASAFIKARQDDYWNKIAQYNKRLHQLEQAEALAKKKHDQDNMRKDLGEQVNMNKTFQNNQKDSDRKLVEFM